MATQGGGAATRWAGVPVARRRDERRDMLVQAAFRLFGDEGEAALTVRAVCREAGLHTRYFYENFTDTSLLLAAVHDREATALGEALLSALEDAGPQPEPRIRKGVTAVLRFLSADPRRGRILFAEAHGDEVLSARRRAAQTELLEALLEMTRVPDPPPALVVAATMFTGAMSELARQWAEGRLGDDLDGVVETAVALALAFHDAAVRAAS
ncbi:TetR/AcrR family transcriptional regulator [Actinocorallia aurea]